jgi:ERCC4-related helicase
MKVKPNDRRFKWPNGARIAITPCVAFRNLARGSRRAQHACNRKIDAAFRATP